MELPLLPREYVLANKRKRIMQACATEIGARGYAGTRIEHLTKAAGIARNTFYEIFSGKEEASRAAIGTGVDEAIAIVGAAALQEATSIEERMRAGLTALLQMVANYPGLARLVLIESPAIAPELHEEMLQRFADLIGWPGKDSRHMVAGGIASILYRRLVEGPVVDDALLEDLVAFATAPWNGKVLSAGAAQA